MKSSEFTVPKSDYHPGCRRTHIFQRLSKSFDRFSGRSTGSRSNVFESSGPGAPEKSENTVRKDELLFFPECSLASR
jgi:hypothetical protein